MPSLAAAAFASLASRHITTASPKAFFTDLESTFDVTSLTYPLLTALSANVTLPWILRSSVCRKVITGAKNVHSKATYAGGIVVSSTLESAIHALRTQRASPNVLRAVMQVYAKSTESIGRDAALRILAGERGEGQ